MPSQLFRNTPIGALYRLTWIHAPQMLISIDTKITGGYISRYLTRTSRYLLHEKHPLVLVIIAAFFLTDSTLSDIVQILFLGLITLCSSLFLYSAGPFLSTSQLMPLAIILPAPYYFTYLCARLNSSVIFESNHRQHLVAYPYDYVLYHPQQRCRTCQFTKPARSKHCSICRVCVARCDHHCIWVNNCLGKENQRWFLMLLLSVGVLELYGSWLVWTVLSPRLGDVRSGNRPTKDDLSLWIRFIRLIIEAVNIGGFSITGVGLLAFMTAPLPLVLLLYHLHLIWAGMTTNETVKWNDWREDMADGVVFRAKRSEVVAAKALEDPLQRSDTMAKDEVKAVSTISDMHNLRNGHSHTGNPLELYIDWPVQSDQILVRTGSGRPPASGQSQTDLWTRCWRLNDVNNIYDLGFWDNLWDVVRG